MRDSFVKFGKSINIAEIGVAAAENAIEMLNNFPLAKFYLIDSYDVNHTTFQFQTKKFTDREREEFIDEVREKLSPFDNRYELIIEDSVVASRRFPDNFFDYIYIDAQHELNFVLIDLFTWYPKLKPGGMFAGHDIGIDGVKDALARFFGSGWVQSHDDWYITKRL